MAVFLAFARIGVTSFGGGLSGWIMQDIVRRRRWIGEEDFLVGLAMSQALPGVNVVNIAIWIGYRLDRGRGALAAVLGIVGPPMLIVSLFAMLYGWLTRFSLTQHAVQGAVSGSIGLMLAMGMRVGRRNLRHVAPALVMAAVFVAVGVCDLPILPVVAGAAPVSVALAWYQERRHAG
jgi:chromate transporter